MSEHAEALALLDRAKAARSDGPQFRFSRCMQLAFNGRLEEAEAKAELKASLRMRGAPGRAAFKLATLRTQTPQRNHPDDLAQPIWRIRALLRNWRTWAAMRRRGNRVRAGNAMS